MPFAHLHELYGNRDGEDLARTGIRSLFPSLFPARDASKQRPHGSEPPVARTGQHPWTSQDGLQFKHQMKSSLFGYEDSNVDLMHVQPHDNCLRCV